MKKIISIICLSLVGIFSHFEESFAEPRQCGTGEYCYVQNKTIPELDVYIANNEIAVNNLARYIRENGRIGKPKEDENPIRKYIIGAISKSIEWESFDELYDFYITSAMESTVPSAIYRDYQKLTNESKRIQRLLSMVSDRNYNDLDISAEKMCEGINGICSVDNNPLEGSVGDLLGKLLENNIKIKRLYRLAINGEESRFKDPDSLFFIPNIGNQESSLDVIHAISRSHFIEQILKHYGANAVAECNMCKGGSYADIAESIKSISQTLKGQSDGYKSWKDAWNLLIGGTESERKAQNERQLLERELYRQGLSTKNADIILGNLDEYNNPENENGRVAGFTWGNNFITNTYNSFVRDTNNDLETFQSTLDSIYNEAAEDSSNTLVKEYTTIEEVIEDKEKIDNSILIAQDIHKLYKVQLEHSQKDDLYGEQLIGRIIDTHLNLVEAIERLNEVEKIAVKVCESQAAGRGKCNYGNNK